MTQNWWHTVMTQNDKTTWKDKVMKQSYDTKYDNIRLYKVMTLKMTQSDDTMWWHMLMSQSDDKKWWHKYMTMFDDTNWWHKLMT